MSGLIVFKLGNLITKVTSPADKLNFRVNLYPWWWTFMLDDFTMTIQYSILDVLYQFLTLDHIVLPCFTSNRHWPSMWCHSFIMLLIRVKYTLQNHSTNGRKLVFTISSFDIRPLIVTLSFEWVLVAGHLCEHLIMVSIQTIHFKCPNKRERI